ncbi:MAG: hypothetical protein IPP25_10135 [Saprospiraceae bacterium]|nr:hypothetical protein [Candidatus Opimibacter skivensis]
MYRVYLDWNVFASLKDKSENQVPNELRLLLEKNKNNLLVPFTSVHIQDLLKGSDDPKNLPLILRDLDLINSITEKHYIEYDIEADRLYPKIADSNLIFENAQEIKNEPLFDPESLLESMSEIGFTEMGESMIELWRRTPTGIDFSNLDKQAGSNEFFRNFLKLTRQENNMLCLMLDLTDFYSDIKSNPEVYKSLSKLFRDMIKIDPKVISNNRDPIPEINKLLKAFNPELDFDTLGTIKSKEDNKYLSSSMIQFAIEFGNLDLAGYHPDKLTEKNTYSNYTNDVHHVYYASSCNYFISNESKLIEKANVMYRKYGIDCIALKPQEFLRDINNQLNVEYTVDSFILSINDTIENRLRKEILDHNIEGATIYLYDPVTRILGYFNYLYTLDYTDDRRTIVLNSDIHQYSRFSFFTEWKSIIYKLYSLLGPDIYNLGEPKIEDYLNFQDADKLERAWVLDNYFCILTLEGNKTHFRLEMNKLTEAFMESLKEE